MGRVRAQEATKYARSPRSSTGGPMAAARIASGLTQQQLADMLGVSRADVNQWETGAGKLPPEYADAVCRITGYTQASEDENISEERLRVGRLIQARREALGLSRQALADSLGLKSQRSVYLWESGKNLPLPCTLERIACAMSCRPEELGGTPRTQASPRIEAIRQMRLGAGLSYRQLAQKTGLADTYISRMERKAVSIPTDRTIALIARACGCSPADYGLDIPADAGLQQPPARQYRYAGFGAYLKSCREREGLTRQAMAERLGVVKALISQYERGLVLPPAARIPELAVLLGESAEQMLAKRSRAAGKGEEQSL